MIEESSQSTPFLVTATKRSEALTTDVIQPTTEKPILFSGEMIRAILEGRKTQTRRVVVAGRRFPQDNWLLNWNGHTLTRTVRDGIVFNTECGMPAKSMQDAVVRCPFGRPGDRLWVRETWNCPRQLGGTHQREKLIFRADEEKFGADYSAVLWAPSIFMPRWASRITLEITGIRVERVQDIGPDDVTAEGLPYRQATPDFLIGSSKPDYQWYWGMPTPSWNGGTDYVYTRDHAEAYRELWNSINEKRGYGWDVNPSVWVIEFKRVLL